VKSTSYFKKSARGLNSVAYVVTSTVL